MASAICRNRRSEMFPLNAFQLFQPMGGVGAGPGTRAAGRSSSMSSGGISAAASCGPTCAFLPPHATSNVAPNAKANNDGRFMKIFIISAPIPRFSGANELDHLLIDGRLRIPSRCARDQQWLVIGTLEPLLYAAAPCEAPLKTCLTLSPSTHPPLWP